MSKTNVCGWNGFLEKYKKILHQIPPGLLEKANKWTIDIGPFLKLSDYIGWLLILQIDFFLPTKNTGKVLLNGAKLLENVWTLNGVSIIYYLYEACCVLKESMVKVPQWLSSLCLMQLLVQLWFLQPDFMRFELQRQILAYSLFTIMRN